MRPDCDCLVVGAGLVGSIAALTLAGRGLRVAVAERRGAPAQVSGADVRALVLSAASVRILEDLGVWPRLAAQATAVREIRVSERGAFSRVTLSADDIGVPALGWTCAADALLAAFNAAVEEHRGITVHWGRRVSALTAAAAAADVALDGDGSVTGITARLVVGADGADSTVRGAAGIGLDRLSYGQQAVVAAVTVERPREYTAFEHFTRRGPLALLPVGGARYVSVQCLDEAAAGAALALDDADYCAMLERRSGGRVGRFSAPGPRRAHALVRQRARSLVAPRTVLIGNAANTVHPNGAQGLNLGLRDVAALAAALDGAADAGAESVLAAYGASRRGDQRAVGAFTHALAQGFTSGLPGIACARRAALALAATATPLRRHLLREASGLAALARIAPAA